MDLMGTEVTLISAHLLWDSPSPEFMKQKEGKRCTEGLGSGVIIRSKYLILGAKCYKFVVIKLRVTEIAMATALVRISLAKHIDDPPRGRGMPKRTWM